MVDESTVTPSERPSDAAVRAYLAAVARAGIPVSFGIVFGSHAAGTADVWSDIDVVVVSPRFDGRRARSDIACYYARRADGTTAAERFSGQPPDDAFQWLLAHLPVPAQPRASRLKAAV